MEPRYLIWSNERGMWWKPNEQGYTTLTHEAGLYTEEQARKIYAKPNFDPGNLNEVVCRAPWRTWAHEQFEYAADERQRAGACPTRPAYRDDIPF